MAKNEIVKASKAELATPEVDAAEAEKANRATRIQDAEMEILGAFGNLQSNEEKGLAILEAAKKAKADDFTKQENDFWKPEKEGDSLQGVYLGSIPDRYITHCIGTLDKKGQPLMMRVKGTKVLTSSLGRVKKGTAVRIVFEGTEKVENGTLRKFGVSVLDVSKVVA